MVPVGFTSLKYCRVSLNTGYWNFHPLAHSYSLFSDFLLLFCSFRFNSYSTLLA